MAACSLYVDTETQPGDAKGQAVSSGSWAVWVLSVVCLAAPGSPLPYRGRPLPPKVGLSVCSWTRLQVRTPQQTQHSTLSIAAHSQPLPVALVLELLDRAQDTATPTAQTGSKLSFCPQLQVKGQRPKHQHSTAQHTVLHCAMLTLLQAYIMQVALVIGWPRCPPDPCFNDAAAHPALLRPSSSPAKLLNAALANS